MKAEDYREIIMGKFLEMYADPDIDKTDKTYTSLMIAAHVLGTQTIMLGHIDEEDFEDEIWKVVKSMYKATIKAYQEITEEEENGKAKES